MKRKVLVVSVAVLALLAVGGHLFLRSKRSQYQGEVRLPGLAQDVEILRDRFAVPHIYAKSMDDAYRALGYSVGQDRLFQLDLLRHVTSGRLSEWFGPALVERDKKLRTLRIGAGMREWLSEARGRCNPRALELAEAYLAGLNHAASTLPTPVEYLVVGGKPEPFSLEDTVAMVAYMALGFAEGFVSDPLLSELVGAFGEQKAMELWSDYPSSGAVIVEDATKKTAGLSFLRRELLAAFEQAGAAPFHGSNSWAVSAARSVTKKPLFANDPHISFSSPSVWYEAHLVAGDFESYGHYLSLVPFAVIGQSRHHAWGFTMFENDDLDFYVETTDDAHPGQVLHRGQWEPLRVTQETILVNGAAPVELTVRLSRHGPIVSDVIDGLERSKQPVSMKWAVFLPENDPISAVFGMNVAAGRDQFTAALRSWLAPGLNILYSDAEHIMLLEAGILPIRGGGARGDRLLDGASGEQEWVGRVPFEDSPKVTDPPGGVIVTANNKPYHGDLPSADGARLYPLTGYWQPSYRATRIQELLGEKPLWSLDGFAAVQQDVVVGQAASLLPVVLPAFANLSDAREQQAAKLLAAWDRRASVDSVGAMLFFELRFQLMRAAVEDELGEERFRSFADVPAFDHALEKLLADPANSWWDDVRTPEKDGAPEASRRALTATLAALEPRFGGRFGGSFGARPLDEWRWGKLHTLTLKHAFGSTGGLLGPIFNLGPFSVPGGRDLVNNLAPSPTDRSYQVTSGPSTRLLVDLGDISHSRGILPTGQSGDFYSPHYSDQTTMFLRGEYRVQRMERSEIEAEQLGRLVLRGE